MPVEKTNRCKLYYGDDLYCKDKKEPYIIEGFLGECDHMLLQAKKGTGKSVTALEIMSAVTTQRPFLDVYPVYKKCNVIWLQGESNHKKYDDRIINMKRAVEIDDSRRTFVNCKRLALNRDRDLDELMTLIAKTGVKYDLFIIDSLYNFVSGTKNSDDVATNWANNVDYMLGEYGAACISLGHTGKDSVFQVKNGKETISKGSSAKGAVEWDAAFTIIYEMVELDKDKHILQLRNHKDRDGDCVKEITYKMIVPKSDPLGRLTVVVEDPDLDSNQNKITRLLKGSDKPLTIAEICDDLTMPESSFYYAVRHCLKTKMITKDRDDLGRVVYGYAL